MKTYEKNVAILIWRLWGGGAERIAGSLSIYLSSCYNVFLFMADTEKIVYGYKGTIVDVEPDGKFEYREENVARAKEKYHIHYSISFLDDMNFINIRTKKKDRVIVSARCTLSYFDPPRYASMYAMKRCFNDADAIVAVSDGVKYEMVSKFGVDPEKIVTIYNFIDQEDVRQKATMKTADGCCENKKLIVNIGRLDKQKNQIRILRQFADLNAKRGDLRLLLIGSGEEENVIKEEIDRLGIGKDVGSISYCSNPFAYLSKAYMYVMASHYEGLPNAILEAMCLQIPVVAVDCLGGPRELLNDTSDYGEKIAGFKTCPRGILVEDAESDDGCLTYHLREAMEFMLDDHEYYIDVKKNESVFMQSYKNEDILRKWLDVIRRTDELDVQSVHIPIDTKKKTVIYGAGKLGKETLKLCRQDKIEVLAFLVTRFPTGPIHIDNIPVIGIDDFYHEPEQIQVLLGLDRKYHDDVVGNLLRKGFLDIRSVPFRKENEEICSKSR